ncbi:DUF3349 domain-containing protein [Mycobacterium sp. TNTM28]|uniref:DUF3349 domain-containing protein n=1 Tax=[Mycobacterium] fortunisiensis TaxID=2600579 RepID=A0ABS6KT45_9MYCO|nr:DUF3349 domain-containing protein [[Mycobacterium] fortunisiensis]MBU9766689.1 DUF3349 domain-containing protein [[Mycobacterium] fortunisiensis]
MAEATSFLDNVLSWLRAGYPEGVPHTDQFALLALLTRSLSEDEIVQAAHNILRSSDGDRPVTDDEIRLAVRGVTDKEPNPEEVNQVASRLASVGWPLATPAR